MLQTKHTPPVEFDAGWLIQRAHQIGAAEGFERVRLDRGALNQDTYYEVGYGPLETVTITSSNGSLLRFTRETWPGAVEASQRIRAFLQALRGTDQ